MWIVTKEAIISIVRTGVTYLYALLLIQFPAVNSWLDAASAGEGTSQFVTGAFVVIVGTGIYGGIRWAAEKWSWIGYLLVINQKPRYG